MSKQLKMYVWEDVLRDYTSGMVCILAHDLEEALESYCEYYKRPCTVSDGLCSECGERLIEPASGATEESPKTKGMTNGKQRVEEILHNSWLEDDYEYDDPDGLHAKEQILAKLKQQDIKSRIDELGNVQLDYGRQTARVWVDGKIIGILERLNQLRSKE